MHVQLHRWRQAEPSSSAQMEPSNKPVKARPFGKDGLSFGDFVDIINPLHHIPIVGSLYRKITGDEIAALPRVAGGGLFGGVIGLGLATVSALTKASTGKDVGQNAFDGIKAIANSFSETKTLSKSETEQSPKHMQPQKENISVSLPNVSTAKEQLEPGTIEQLMVIDKAIPQDSTDNVQIIDKTANHRKVDMARFALAQSAYEKMGFNLSMDWMTKYSRTDQQF